MDNFWTNNPDLMMKRANALRRIVKEMEAGKMAGEWSEGMFMAAPMLLERRSASCAIFLTRH